MQAITQCARMVYTKPVEESDKRCSRPGTRRSEMKYNYYWGGFHFV